MNNDRINRVETAVGTQRTKSQTLSRELNQAKTNSAKEEKEIGKKDKEIEELKAML